MPKFYEIRDSLLESIKQDAERVSIHLRAVRAEVEPGQQLPSNLLRQEVRLVLDGAKLTVDSANLPTWLMEGTFNTDALDADLEDCGISNTIPVSLRSASGVELSLAGLHEGSGDFVTIRVQASSLTIELLGDPQSLQHTRASF